MDGSTGQQTGFTGLRPGVKVDYGEKEVGG